MVSKLDQRLALLAFAGVAAAISINALYLQDGASPKAPGAAAPTTPSPPQKTSLTDITAALPPMKTAGAVNKPAAQAAPALKPPAAPSPGPDASVTPKPMPAPAAAPTRLETIRAVQRELTRRGYRAGADDGRLRMMTREAVIAYEFDRNLPLSGEPSEALLKDLLFAPPSKDQRAAPPRFEANAGLIAAVQVTLGQLGYGPPAASGALDEATRDALRQFQNDRKLAVTGNLSERLLLELYIVTGKAIDPRG